MSITLPTGWERQVRSDGAIAYVAPAASGQGEVQFMSVNAPSMDASSAHAALWSQTKQQLQAHANERSGALGRFQWSEAEAFDPAQNRRLWVRLYTALEGATFICAMVGAEAQRAFQRNVAAIDGVLAEARFSSASTASSTTRSIEDDVPIVESLIHVDVQGISLGSNVRTDHVLLFGNGVAVRTGVIDGPRECYAALPVANLPSTPHNYGSWRESSRDVIAIGWQEGAPWRLQREGDRWTLEGKRLLKLRSIDGARFNGVYIYRPVGDAPSALKLSPDGRFEALNLRESMTCAGGGAPITEGAGAYEVRKWTLILRFDGGRGVVMAPLHITDQERDLQNVGAFALKSYKFSRM